MIYAGTRGYLDKIAVNKIAPFQEALIAKLKSSYPQFMEGIRTQKALTPELEGQLKEALDSQVAAFAA